MGNQVVLEFLGDAGSLQSASRRADDALNGVGDSVTTASDEMRRGEQASSAYADRIGSIGAGVTGMSDAVEGAAGSVQALADFQSAGAERAEALARAQADVEQAMLDGEQATIDLEQATIDLTQAQADGRQAGIDLEQAQIDVKQAQIDAKAALEEYTEAVKKHGAGSAEAQQAAVDLQQAELDEKQAQEDANQARIDANQALTDQKQFTLDASQAVRDGKDAQLNLNSAMREANPSGLQQWADKINLITPLLSALVGIVGLVTAAQWAWNAAFLASPITWIVAGIALVVGAIVLIATKTDWFQRAWKNSWGAIRNTLTTSWNWIKTVASAIAVVWDKSTSAIGRQFVNLWNRIKGVASAIRDAFNAVGRSIGSAFRGAFNTAARVWNSTVGRLSWTVPGWIPGIGGNTISAPSLPTFHAGGIVPGIRGQEVVARLQAGERVVSNAGSGGAGPMITFGSDGSRMGNAIVAVIEETMRAQFGGDPERLGIRVER